MTTRATAHSPGPDLILLPAELALTPELTAHARKTGRAILRDWAPAVEQAASVLFIAPNGHRLWEQLLSRVLDGEMVDTALFLLPLQRLEDLGQVLGASAAQASTEPWNGEVFHSRPYCGRLDSASRGQAALCTAPGGGLPSCHDGRPCAATGATRIPVDTLAPGGWILNGCSTALPPVRGLTFGPGSLLGMQLARSGRSVLGNLSLGPAGEWELVALDALHRAGVRAPERLRAINAAPEQLGHPPGWRLVGLGDGCAWPTPTPLPGQAQVHSGHAGGATEIHWPGSDASRLAWLAPEQLPSARGWVATLLDGQGQPCPGPAPVCLPLRSRGQVLVALPGDAHHDIRGVRIRPLPQASWHALDELSNLHSGLVAATVAGPGLQLGPELDLVSRAEDSLRTIAHSSRLRPPDPARFQHLVECQRATSQAVAAASLYRFVEATTQDRLSLGRLYREGPRGPSHRAWRQTCPSCTLPAWTRLWTVQGLDLGQTHCPQCAIVWTGPAQLRPGPSHCTLSEGRLRVELTLVSHSSRQLLLATAWRRDSLGGSEPAPPAADPGPPRTVDAGESVHLAKALDGEFHRSVQLLYTVDGAPGFVQLKDAHPRLGS